MKNETQAKNFTGNGAVYSALINPEDYIRTISDEHLYIRQADRKLEELIKRFVGDEGKCEVVELGCGPGRLMASMADIPGIRLTGIDVDDGFLDYANQSLKHKSVNLVNADAASYTHPRSVDCFYSSGVHHHISKGETRIRYLKNVFSQLVTGGCYILADEFIPEYQNEEQRSVKLVIWYSHIIANALKNNYMQLASEEAKIMLDDLLGSQDGYNQKSQSQVELILRGAIDINNEIISERVEAANKKSESLLLGIKSNRLTEEDKLRQGLQLSRGDYKICHSVLVEELSQSGFYIQEVFSFGKQDLHGAMSVYLLRKQDCFS